jgi:hypothetical protein
MKPATAEALGMLVPGTMRLVTHAGKRAMPVRIPIAR